MPALSAKSASRAKETGVPLALGVLVVVLPAFVPLWLAFPVGLFASGLAGWLLPDAPIRAGALVFAPTAALILLGGAKFAHTVFVIPLITGFVSSLVGSHFGGGMALRRRARREASRS